MDADYPIFNFLNFHAYRFQLRCSIKALRDSQQLRKFILTSHDESNLVNQVAGEEWIKGTMFALHNAGNNSVTFFKVVIIGLLLFNTNYENIKVYWDYFYYKKLLSVTLQYHNLK